MKVLRDSTARELLRRLRERDALPPRPLRVHNGARRSLLPFTCRLVFDEESRKTRLSCYVTPYYDRGIVSLRRGDVIAHLDTSDADVKDGWKDCGEIERGAEVWLVPYVDQSEWDLHKEATPIIDYLRYRIGRSAHDVGDGHSCAGPLAPSVLLARWEENGLRQYFVGPYYMNHSQADSDIQDGDGFTPSFPRTLSITGDQGAMRSLYGFREPSTISNPYASESTAPSDASRFLVLVREKNESGDAATLKYLSLSELAAATDGKAPDPSGLDQIRQDLQNLKADQASREGVPCPVDGNGDLAVWDACAQEWKSLRAVAGILANALAGKFWEQGGNENTNYGSTIGNSSKDIAIYLDSKELAGDWNCYDFAAHNLTADGEITSRGDIADGKGTLDEVRTYALAHENILGDHERRIAALEALTARVAALEEILRGVSVQPLAFGDGTTLQVLAKQ